MQAPKNGFFYVLDRITGEFISAEAYANVTWAKGIDAKTGRPIENPEMRYREKSAVVSPGSGGGHNWHPMAYSPQTGLVYIPGSNSSRVYTSSVDFVPQKGKQVTGVTMNNFAEGILPENARVTNMGNFLKAWDPVQQKERWSVPYATGGFSGGVVATGGNLVFAAAGDGRLTAYSADKGEKLWESRIAAGVATPITYELDGKQYVAVMAGRGGRTPGRLYVYELDGKAPMPVVPPAPAGPKPAPTKPVN
jgi:quinohemoprotein ethanol dehydrogenase